MKRSAAGHEETGARSPGTMAARTFTSDGHSTSPVEVGNAGYGCVLDMSITTEPDASARFFAKAARYISYNG
jgi:hypothetical protein